MVGNRQEGISSKRGIHSLLCIVQVSVVYERREYWRIVSTSKMSAWGAPKRSRPREDLTASFSKLSRIVSEIKRKRKSLAAHHNLVVELIASPSFSGFPLFPLSASVAPSKNPKLSATLPSRSPQNPSLSAAAAAPPSQIPCHPKLPATLASEIPQSAAQVPTSAKSVTDGNPLKLSGINPQQVSVISPIQISGSSPAQLFQEDAMENKAHMPPFPSTANHPGKLAAKSTFWAALLLAFLCTFLCTGKEIAVGMTIAAYLIIWLRLRLGFVAKQQTAQPISNPTPLYHHDVHDNPARGEYRAMLSGNGRPLNRSSTIPALCVSSFPSSASLQLTTRSKSLPRLRGSVQEELQPSEPGSSVDSASNICSVLPSSLRIEAGKVSARLKLQMMLLLVLCGLLHGRIMAVCMTSCCILIFSKFSGEACVKYDITIRCPLCSTSAE